MEDSRNATVSSLYEQHNLFHFFSILVQDCSTAICCQWVEYLVISLMAPLIKLNI